ncbi:MAG: DUF2061 domain-containing protein [Bacteroidota bacterium]
MLDVLINQTGRQGSSGNRIKVSDRADKPVKSLIKAISWRIVGTVDTMVISYILTGKAAVALSIGSVEVLSKTILYYFHERLWAHIHSLRFQVLLRKNVKRFKFKRAAKPTQKQASRKSIKNSFHPVSG